MSTLEECHKQSRYSSFPLSYRVKCVAEHYRLSNQNRLPLQTLSSSTQAERSDLPSTKPAGKILREAQGYVKADQDADKDSDGGDGEEADEEVDDFPLREEDEPVSVASLKKLAARDETLTEEEKAKAKKTARGVDEWVHRYIQTAYGRVSPEVQALVSSYRNGCESR